MLTAVTAAGVAFTKFVVIPTIVLFAGQEAYDDWTYESRVQTCIEQVKELTTNTDFIREAEVNCRKSLK